MLTNERPTVGDWMKGPAGTGETTWAGSTFNIAFQRGEIAESWEFPDPDTIVFHIRQGIHFHDKPPVNGREVTAEDVAYSIQRHYDSKGSYIKRVNSKWFKSVEATDKWTVVIKGDDAADRTSRAFSYLSDFPYILPREMIEEHGDMKDWRNSCGTGPFMLVDYVPVSSHTYKRNPNWWMKDPLHPENQLPYVDGIVHLYVVDYSTRLAAFRTGKVDQLGTYTAYVQWEEGEHLLKANPEVQWVRRAPPTGYGLTPRVDIEGAPVSDLKVRRALMMAIDHQEMKDELYGGNARILAWPASPLPEYSGAYTSLEEQPESTRQNFEYHPDKAMELLAEAGYPDGFSTNVITIAKWVDLFSVVKEYWSKIGVDLEINVFEAGVYTSKVNAKDFTAFSHSMGAPSLFNKLLYWYPGSNLNYNAVDDPFINETRDAIWAVENIENPTEQDRLMKKAAAHMLDQVYTINTPTPFVYVLWWPWLQNYHAECTIGSYNYFLWGAYVWLDRDMREEMTGRR